MRQRPFERIAVALEERISRNPAYALPRIMDLAVEFHVAYSTMWKALQILIGKGLISSPGGSKLSIAGRNDPLTLIKPKTAVDALSDAIRSRILDGVYKSGSPFPKAGYFIATHGVSYITVSHAFARLAAENLAHKNRSRWFVGPRKPPGTPRSSPGADAPTILSITEKVTAWSLELGGVFTDRYLSPFDEELTSHGYRALPCLLIQEISDPAGLPTGAEQVGDAARALKERYHGALLRRVHPNFFADARSLLHTLIKRRKPVVYFDSTDEGGTVLSRKELSAGRDYFRLHLDLKAGVMAALQALAQAGHRVIALHGAERSDWGMLRSRLIVECAATFDPPLTIVTGQPAEDLWAFGTAPFNRTFVQRLADKRGIALDETGNRELGAMREALIDNASSLVALLVEHRPTALIALNDMMAWEYYLWFRALGIEVPRDLSMISFDNLAPAAPLPVSSVDWGFRRLGYLAAHILIGDLPITADRNGNIAGRCFVSDHGSVAQPGDLARLARALRT